MLLAILALTVIVAAGWATQHFGLAPSERYAQLWLAGAVLCGVIAWATGRGSLRWVLGGILFSPVIVGPALLIDFAIRRARRKRESKVTSL